MEKLWDELKEKCLTNANKCLKIGEFEEAERLLNMALGISNATAPSELQPGEYIEEKVRTQERQMQELEGLARPIIEFLRENYHPYTTVVIGYDKIQLDETTLWIPQNDYAD